MWQMLLGAGLGALSANQKQKAEEENNKMQAELTRYSPWTGMKGTISHNAPSMLDGVLQGGMGGMGVMQEMNKMQGPQAAAVDLNQAPKGYQGWDVEPKIKTGKETMDSSYYQQVPNFYV